MIARRDLSKRTEVCRAFRTTNCRRAAVLVAVVFATSCLGARAAERKDLIYKWSTPEGEVVEFRYTGDDEVQGVLLAASPKGLGKYFPPGSEALLGVGVGGNEVTCRFERRLEPANDAEKREPWIVRGEAKGTLNEARNFIRLAVTVKRFREIHDEDGWVTQKPERDEPPITLTLTRVEIAEVRFARTTVDGIAALPRQSNLSFAEPYYVEVLFHTEQPDEPRTVKLDCDGNGPRELIVTRTESPKLFRSRVLYIDKAPPPKPLENPQPGRGKR